MRTLLPAPTFVPCVPLDSRRVKPSARRATAARAHTAARRRRRCDCAAKPPYTGNGRDADDDDDDDDDERGSEQDRMTDSYFRKPWDDPKSPGEDMPTEPLDEAQEKAVRARLPQRIAEFVIRRAAGAGRKAATVMSLVESDAGGAVDEELEREYEDYVYESDRNVETSLFMDEDSQADADAKQAGYGALALFALFVLFKTAASLVGFFVNSAFSFLAIFALSAGIFMVIILFRF